jgi:RNA polymerase sigma-70 factor (ECF subfamily)
MSESMKKLDFKAQALPQIDNLYRTALYVSDDESKAYDLVQESFVKAYHSWPEGQISPNPRVWLFRIMTNVLINKYRSSSSLSAAENGADEFDGYLMYSRWINKQPVDDGDQVSFSAISENQVKKAIGGLPEDLRLIVVLSLLEGFSYQEIADIAGINMETVRSRLHQGRKLIQRELFDHVVCAGKNDMPADRVRSTRSG